MCLPGPAAAAMGAITQLSREIKLLSMLLFYLAEVFLKPLLLLVQIK